MLNGSERTGCVRENEIVGVRAFIRENFSVSV